MKKRKLKVLFLIIIFLLMCNIKSYATESFNNINNILDKISKFINNLNIIDIIAINVLVAIFFIFIIKKYIKIGKELNIVPEYDFKYFKEIPNEIVASPAKALAEEGSYIFYALPELFAAIVFDLCVKNYIRLEVINDKSTNIEIIHKPSLSSLPEEEMVVYNIIENAMGKSTCIELNTLNEYFNNNYEYVYKQLKSIDKIIKNNNLKNGNIDINKEKSNKKFKLKAGICFSIIAVFLFLYSKAFIISNESLRNIINFFVTSIPNIYIGLIVCATIFVYNSQSTIYSEKYFLELAQWRGLCSYLVNYDLQNEKKAPKSELLEKYLVYATTWNFSKEFILKLKKCHPEIFNKSYSSYPILNLLCNNGDENYFETIRRKLESSCKKVIKLYLPNEKI